MKSDRQHGRVTLADTASEIGVSKVTVSYILNNRETTVVVTSPLIVAGGILRKAPQMAPRPHYWGRGAIWKPNPNYGQTRNLADTVAVIFVSPASTAVLASSPPSLPRERIA